MANEGLYVGSGEARRFVSKTRAKKIPSFLKFGPGLILVLFLIVALIAIFGSTSLLGPHISALITAATQTDYTAYEQRSNALTIQMLQGKLEMPESFKSRLEEEGIIVKDSSTLVFDDTEITATNYMSMYNGNVNFREAIINSKNGRAALFFDDVATTFYEKLGLSRDVLHNYENTGEQTTDAENYDKLMTEYFDVEANSTIATAETRTVTNDSGEDVNETVSTGSSASSNSSSGSDAKERAKTFLDSVGDTVASRSAGCSASAVGDMVATAVASNAKYTYAQSFMTKMESISKAMAGYGNTSGINSVLNWFTTSATSTVYNPTTGEESSTTGSPLESEAMKNILSNVPINQSKASSYSLERAFNSTSTSLQNENLSTEACANEQNTLLSLNAAASPGSSFISSTIGTLLQTTLLSGIKISASSTLSLLIPEVAEVMYTNAYTDSAGIAGGEEFGMGAGNINQLASQQNSAATGASKENILAYNKENNATIAQLAEIDRKNYSPFDVSNPNTFLGSIVSSVLPLATSTNSLFSPLSTFSSISSTSLASLNQTYADGENTTFLTTFGKDCTKASSIGGAANAYCNMIDVNDLSIINLTEDDPAYQAAIANSIEYDENGNEVVKDGSPLADFITYWMGRYSMPGVYDANIANACSENLTGNIPILSDIVAMVKSIDDEYCRGIADGSHYIYSDSNPYWETEKYHQLWALTTRVKENLGFYENSENPLTAYREHYEELHPLDNSRSGYLARISGLTKEDSETVLALFDYYNYVANYDPTTTYRFAEIKGEEQDLLSSQQSEEKNISTVLEQESTTTYPVSKRRSVGVTA